MSNDLHSFFSVSFELVSTGRKLPYDLYINSSILESREKFVRIFPSGETLTDIDVETFRKKYRLLYVAENQRSVYLSSLCSDSGKNELQKTSILKDSAIQYLDRIFDENKEFSTDVLTETISGCRDVVANMVDVLHNYKIDQLQDLIGNLSFHDFYTYDHSINVSMYCILIYRALNPQATREEIIHAGLGGLLHDLGKIKIPTHILNNAGKLNEEQFNEIKKHPEYGCQLLVASAMNLPGEIDPLLLSRVVYEHHENFDGTGYPRKISGNNIHLYARVTAIADFFDAVTTKRSYHKPLSTEDAIALMTNSVGKKIDPKIFQIFVANAKHVDIKQPSPFALPDDFDPCQPHAELPLKKSEIKLAPEKLQNYGKVKIIGSKEELKEWGSLSNVEIISAKKPKRSAG